MRLSFVADESVDAQIVDGLRAQGLKVQFVAELAPGITDDEVLDQANREQALLLTTDKDFGELVFRQGRVAAGIVLIRLAGLTPEAKTEKVLSSISKHEPKLLGSFSVISPGSLRIRSAIFPHAGPGD